MSDYTIKLKRIISLVSANGYWAKYYIHSGTREGPYEFERIAFWLAGEFVYSDSGPTERVVPIMVSDVPLISTIDENLGIVDEWFSLEVFHDSDFEELGKTLKNRIE